MKAFIAALGIVAVLASANNADAKGYAGVKGGVNIGSLSGDGTDALESRTGFDGGVFYGMPVNDRFGVRREARDVEKGAEGPFPKPQHRDNHESVNKKDYVELPVLVTATFPVKDQLEFEFFAGPTFAFNTKAELEVPEHNETEDLGDVVESFEFGGAIGGGVEYKLSSFSIIADVRYSMGFSNIASEGEGDTKNRGIGIMGGIQIPFGSGE
jgi:hypothetical protein